MPKNFTKEEIKEMKELDKIWKEIDEGKGKTCTVKEFFESLKRDK